MNSGIIEAMQMFVYTICTFVLLWIGYHTLRLAYLGNKAVTFGKTASKVSRTPIQANTTVLVIGDSTAVGVGAEDPSQSLVGRLVTDLPSASITNNAVNGIDTKTLSTSLGSIASNSYDFVIIHIGGIDTVSCSPLTKTQHYLDLVLQESKRIAKRDVFLVSVNNAGLVPFFPFPINRLFTHRSRSISKISEQLCSKHECIHIPLFSERNEDELAKNPKKYISSDLIHPNDAGYGIWYEKIKLVLLPVIR